MILVIGEALIDLIENRYQPGSFNAIVGGANANVSIALARRGTKQQFLVRLSGDSFGKTIRAKLMENNVSLDYAVAAEEQTTIVTVSISAS
jgi:fructokinase